MGDPKGFIKIKKKPAGYRLIHERVGDYSEVEQVLNSEDRQLQASRCMDCGIPFCHWGCPVDNLIPEWNELLYEAIGKAQATVYILQIIFLSLQEGSARPPVSTPVY